MLILLLLLQVIPANDMNTEGFGDFGFRSGVWYGEYMDRTCVYGKHFFFMCWCAQLMSFSMYQKSKLRSSLSKSPWLWSSQTQNFRTDVLLASCQPQVWSGNELVLICVYVNVHIPTSFTSPPPKYFRILLSLIFLFFSYFIQGLSAISNMCRIWWNKSPHRGKHVNPAACSSADMWSDRPFEGTLPW